MPAKKTFVVERNNPENGKLEQFEVQAERAETEGGGSSRVTFYNGDEPVASFINTQGWHEKSSK